MSARTTRIRRTAVVAATLVTAAGLSWGVPGAASAHPGVFDSETCAQSLTRVWSWPGTLGADGPVIFSDAYESYLLRQPPCTPPSRPSPSRWDHARVGHGFPL